MASSQITDIISDFRKSKKNAIHMNIAQFNQRYGADNTKILKTREQSNALVMIDLEQWKSLNSLNEEWYNRMMDSIWKSLANSEIKVHRLTTYIAVNGFSDKLLYFTRAREDPESRASFELWDESTQDISASAEHFQNLLCDSKNSVAYIFITDDANWSQNPLWTKIQNVQHLQASYVLRYARGKVPPKPIQGNSGLIHIDVLESYYGQLAKVNAQYLGEPPLVYRLPGPARPRKNESPSAGITSASETPTPPASNQVRDGTPNDRLADVGGSASKSETIAQNTEGNKTVEASTSVQAGSLGVNQSRSIMPPILPSSQIAVPPHGSKDHQLNLGEIRKEAQMEGLNEAIVMIELKAWDCVRHIRPQWFRRMLDQVWASLEARNLPVNFVDIHLTCREANGVQRIEDLIRTLGWKRPPTYWDQQGLHPFQSANHFRRLCTDSIAYVFVTDDDEWSHNPFWHQIYTLENLRTSLVHRYNHEDTIHLNNERIFIQEPLIYSIGGAASSPQETQGAVVPAKETQEHVAEGQVSDDKDEIETIQEMLRHIKDKNILAAIKNLAETLQGVPEQ